MNATALSFPTSVQDLDFQRIAGTSLVIALHAAVALVLFMPVQQVAAPVAEDLPLILSVIPKYIPPPPPPPPPPIDSHVIHTAQQAAPTAVVQSKPTEEIVDPTDQGKEPYIPPHVDAVIPHDIGPSFVEIAADIAPAPTYPTMALRRAQEGRVLLRVLVDEQGRPAQVSVEQSSGFRLLDESALKIVQSRWHFVPAQRNGIAIAAYALVPVVFQIAR
jgi:protein TonB